MNVRYGKSALYKLAFMVVQVCLTPVMSLATMARLVLEDTRLLLLPDNRALAAATSKLERRVLAP